MVLSKTLRSCFQKDRVYWYEMLICDNNGTENLWRKYGLMDWVVDSVNKTSLFYGTDII